MPPAHLEGTLVFALKAFRFYTLQMIIYIKSKWATQME